MNYPLKLSFSKSELRAMSTGDEANMKTGEQREVYLVEKKKNGFNGLNGLAKWKDAILFLVLGGIIWINIRGNDKLDDKLERVLIDPATIKQKVIDHEEWGYDEGAQMWIDINKNSVDIQNLLIGEAEATADRITKTEANNEHYKIKQWVRENYKPKN